MAKLKILVYPDERLSQVSQPVKAIDNKITSFISDLEDPFFVKVYSERNLYLSK